GEPLVRPDILSLIAKARQLGLHIVLSTNGTLLDEKTANQLASYKISYVGISLDGLGKTNDYFRGVEGTFERALRGFRACVNAGVKVGLRLTLTKHTGKDLDAIFDLIEKEGVNRACFYHLVPSGRGKDVVTLDPQESRRAIDTILQRTKDFHSRGLRKEILTVDNHCDGPYMYLKLLEEGNPRAEEVYNLLKWNGGGLYSSGVGIGCIDNIGNVHPDQFWSHYTLGNIRQRPFSQIWTDTSEPLLGKLKNRKPNLKGRCAECKFVNLCGGSFRVRADIATGDPFAPDPACYLTDEEIGLKTITQVRRNYTDINNAPKLGGICACQQTHTVKKSLRRSV
ncbi:radical SAM protein, partial [Candidatus Peregrinibacteria bacterium]|nr:radical SAM protein [Candidatus Peregrinibacteria bacterium]